MIVRRHVKHYYYRSVEDSQAEITVVFDEPGFKITDSGLGSLITTQCENNAEEEVKIISKYILITTNSRIIFTNSTKSY